VFLVVALVPFAANAALLLGAAFGIKRRRPRLVGWIVGIAMPVVWVGVVLFANDRHIGTEWRTAERSRATDRMLLAIAESGGSRGE
jgi:hypothetical protein